MGYERECNLCTFLLGYLDKIAADIPEEALGKRTGDGGNPPGWILGHLASVSDFALRLLGQAPRLPKPWHQQFSPGSPPAPDATYPPKQELLAAVQGGYRAAVDAARTADPAAHGDAHGLGMLDGTPIRTKADLISHLLTTHLATHTGQLSYWRRCAGHKPLL
ncbi:MAG: DinB family protein [Phycisphaerae bacterium]|jgi:hypothetical protein|nr:DinB family protein [Phycisphaerae bacterium]MCZ2399497.1 DinB family protein [Phycisphaerae bacterium]